MRLRFAALLMLAGAVSLGLAGGAEAQEKAGKPTIILRLSSLDSLIADATYLAKKAGQGDMADQVGGLLKSMTGPKGLEGVDTTKPMGLYARLGPNGIDSDVVVLLPVADQKTVLAFLERQNVNFKKEEGGVYSVEVPRSPFPGFFRFANNYAYVTIREAKIIAPNNLLDPTKVLSGDKDSVAALTVNLDQIPEQMRELALGQLELGLAQAKEEGPANETDSQKKLRLATVDAFFAQIKAVITEGQELKAALKIDQKTDEMSAALSLSGKSGSKLAGRIADLGQVMSIGASVLSKSAAFSGMSYLQLPEQMQAAMGPFVDEGIKQAMAKAKSDAERDLIKNLLNSLAPTVKSGLADVGMSLRPASEGRYTLIVGSRVKGGEAIETAVKKAIAHIPDDQKKAADIKLDRAKVGSVNIHSFVPPKADEDAKRVFGEDLTVFFALRDDAAFLAIGENALATLKEAIASRPAAGEVLQGSLSVTQLMALSPDQNRETIQKVAKQVFGQDKEADRIYLTVEGGKALKMSIRLKAQLLELAVKVAEARRDL